MFNLDNITKKDDNKEWPYRKLIIGPSRSGKTNYLLNLIQKDNNIIDKIYLHTKDLEEPQYQFLIDEKEKAGLKTLNDIKAHLLNIHQQWMISLKTLKITTKKEREKF